MLPYKNRSSLYIHFMQISCTTGRDFLSRTATFRSIILIDITSLRCLPRAMFNLASRDSFYITLIFFASSFYWTTVVYVDKPPTNIAVMAVIPKFVSKWRWNADEAVADWKSICSSPISSPFSIGSFFIPAAFFSWLWSVFHVFFDSHLVPGLCVVGLSISENTTI